MSSSQLTFKIIFPIIVVISLIIYFLSFLVAPEPKKVLSIATGSKNQSYYKTALQYQKLLAKQNVTLHIIETSGSIENLKLMRQNKVDIAFVQGGILNAKIDKNTQSLASVYYEPLWIFYKNQGYTMDYIIELIGHKVAIGASGSGTRHLTLQILKDNGITSKNTTFLPYSVEEAKEKLKSGEIDALFCVTSPKSDLVTELLSNQDIELFNIKRVNAYNQKYKFLSSLVLYEGTIDMYKNLPSENKNMLSTTANLVCRKDLNSELIRIFLKKIKKVHSKKSIFGDENQFPSLKNLDTEINKEAKKYLLHGDSWLESIFPFWIASQIDRLKILLIPLLTLLFPLLKGALPLYTWSIRSKIYRWYRRLDALEYLSNSSKEELQEYILSINQLKHEVQSQTKVPLSYKWEYYNLLLHIDLVLKEISSKLDTLTKQQEEK